MLDTLERQPPDCRPSWCPGCPTSGLPTTLQSKRSGGWQSRSLAAPKAGTSSVWTFRPISLGGKGHSMRRIALVSLKGGVGKTASATALAVGLARRGQRTLLIDADQQSNATWTILGGQGSDPPTLASVLTRQVSAVDAIRETSTPGLDLLPADAALGGVNVELAQVVGRDTRLRSALASIEGRYDFVLIDTGPQLTTVLVNVLVYVDEVIAPRRRGRLCDARPGAARGGDRRGPGSVRERRLALGGSVT